MRVLLTSVWITLTLALVWAAAPSAAQDDEPIVDSWAEYTFGDELRFMLTATGAGDVERLRLSFRPEFAAELYVVDVPFQPGETISVTYPVKTSLIGLKPYGELTYSWELQAGEGVHHTTEQQFAYEDDQFSWLQTAREAATVHWAGNGPAFGQDVLNVVDASVQSLAAALSLEGVVPFDVYVYPSSAELRAGFAAAELDPEVTTHPELGAIFVTAVNPQSVVADLGQSVPYELAQLFLYQLGPGNFESFPYWFKEGLGITFQSRVNPTYEQTLEQALQAGATYPLWQLCRSPEETGIDETLARAQSASVVHFVRERFGDRRTAELARAYAAGRDCPAGVEYALGINLDQLQSRWLSAQKTPSALGQFVNDYGLWILILLAGFALAGIIVHISISRSRS